MASKRGPAPLPTREQLLDFIRDSDRPVGVREAARAFGLKGSQRRELAALLDALAEDGLIEGRKGRRRSSEDGLPPVAVVEIAEIDEDGELIARPANWRDNGAPPRIYMAPEKRGLSAAGIGDRMLARLTPADDGAYTASVIRRLSSEPGRIVGIYETASGGRVSPTDRRQKNDVAVAPSDAAGAKSGELVIAELLPGRRLGLREAKVVERLGSSDEPRAISLIAIHNRDIPTAFPAEAQAEADAAQPVTLDGRTDLRSVPLVTIDGADARDFDDAVWAAPDDDGRNRGGFKLIVAIADVAHYVRPGSALDRTAYDRGNSVYFPDRVVPMLPEALSNGLCSLRPGEDRGCLACHMQIDKDGALIAHRFERAVMRSAARLTYEQTQAAFDGSPDDKTRSLTVHVLEPLYRAFAALAAARNKRQALEIDLPERQVVLGADGRVAAITPRPRLDSHRLVEEFMIAANVAAAEALEAKRAPCMYRIHDEPDAERVDALREVVDAIGLNLARGAVRPAQLNRLLAKAANKPEAHMVNMLVLRAQAQAEYNPQNIGHFGLALPRYAHFTSPIRRYSDLLVHRSLIGAYKLGTDGIKRGDKTDFVKTGEHISNTERRAVAAERDALDRYTAAFLQDKIGAEFTGTVNGVTRFGLFVELDETGADGLVPISTLPRDYYVHDEAAHALIGRESGRTFTLGQAVTVRLTEANPVKGSLVFHVVGADDDGAGGRPARKGKARGRGPRTRPGARRRQRRN